MTIQEFVNKYNGKKIEVAGSSALNQCVDLANAYIREVLEYPIIEWTNAKDFPLRGGDRYNFIANTPEGVPQEGDLVIWGGEYGHIAIYLRGDVNSFTSFDQNFPTGSACHEQWHNYANVIGWMRPANLQSPDTSKNVKKAVQFDREVSYNYSVGLSDSPRSEDYLEDDRLLNIHIGLHKETQKHSETIKEQEGIITIQNDRIEELEKELVAFIERNEELAVKVDELEIRNEQLKKELEACESQPPCDNLLCPPWMNWLIKRFCNGR